MSNVATLTRGSLASRFLSVPCTCTHPRQAHAALSGVCQVCGPEHELWEVNDYTSGERVRYFVTDEPTPPQGTKSFEWSAYSHLEGCGAYVVRGTRHCYDQWRVPRHFREAS